MIPMNSKTGLGRNVFLGARGMFNSSNRVRAQQRAVAQWEEGGGGLNNEKDVNNRGDFEVVPY